jgi:prenyltransferase beta subunit
MDRYIDRNDPDILGELVSCMRFLRFVDVPVYGRGLAYLLDAQNEDGSWGSYPKAEVTHGSYVRQGWLLHTTLVALDALTVAFHEPWNVPLSQACP